MYKGEYIPPTLVIDSVIFQLINNQLSVLLIKRTNEPFKNSYALPGAYNAAGETTYDAMARTLKIKAGIDVGDLKVIEQLYTFDTVARDPRGHAVSVSYMGLGKDLIPEGNPNTQAPVFFPVNELPDMAFDHKDIIKYAHERLKSKLTYTNAVFALLDPKFTMSQLQSAYEAVLGQKLDKRNFRKKYLSLGLIYETEEFMQEGAHRPARLYRFNQQKLESLSRSFD